MPTKPRINKKGGGINDTKRFLIIKKVIVYNNNTYATIHIVKRNDVQMTSLQIDVIAHLPCPPLALLYFIYILQHPPFSFLQ